MKSKKIFLLAFALMLTAVLSLTACNSSEEKPSDDKQEEKESTEEAGTNDDKAEESDNNKNESQESDSEETSQNVGAFETKNLNGETVTNEIFAENKLTVINVFSVG